MPVKYFTLDQANRTLPLVGRVVTDIVDEYRRWKDLIFRYELIAAGSKADAGESEEQVGLRVKVDESAQRINRYVEELSEVGCVFKGFEEGLVDFHTHINGQEAFLCWKLGEAAIEYWHDLESGYGGRQTLSQSSEARDQGQGSSSPDPGPLVPDP